jgi:hypothetical protein
LLLTFDRLPEANATRDVVTETETEAVIAEDLAHQAIGLQDPLVVRARLIRIQLAETTGSVSVKTGILEETEEVEEKGIGIGIAGPLDVMREEMMMTGHRGGIETSLMIDVQQERGEETVETVMDSVQDLGGIGKRVLLLHPRRRSRRQT